MSQTLSNPSTVTHIYCQLHFSAALSVNLEILLNVSLGFSLFMLVFSLYFLITAQSSHSSAFHSHHVSILLLLPLPVLRPLRGFILLLLVMTNDLLSQNQIHFHMLPAAIYIFIHMIELSNQPSLVICLVCQCSKFPWIGKSNKLYSFPFYLDALIIFPISVWPT